MCKWWHRQDHVVHLISPWQIALLKLTEKSTQQSTQQSTNTISSTSETRNCGCFSASVSNHNHSSTAISLLVIPLIALFHHVRCFTTKMDGRINGQIDGDEFRRIEKTACGCSSAGFCGVFSIDFSVDFHMVKQRCVSQLKCWKLLWCWSSPSDQTERSTLLTC